MAKSSKSMEQQVVRLRKSIENAQARLRKKELDLAAAQNPEVQELTSRLKEFKKQKGTAARMRALFNKKLKTLCAQVEEKKAQIEEQLAKFEEASSEIATLEITIEEILVKVGT